MKILRISLRNIASLEGTQTVDFTRDPLRAAGLFSISGPTGSGKSTLLDALCLALYDATPRLRNVGRLAELAGGETQNDPRNLLRRGSGEGFAEVAFIGVDNAAYTARWTVHRTRNRADGALQNTEIALFRGDIPPGAQGQIEQGGRKTEVLPVIAAKIGLSFEQFTRAVLLAQNDFATFLKADDKERAEILQALTGTERFERISIFVFNRCASELRAIADIESRLGGNAPLAPEARTEAETAVAAVDAAWKEANEKFAKCETHAVWFTRLAELSREATAAANSLREKSDTREAAAPRRLELARTEEAARAARPLRDAAQRTATEKTDAGKVRDEATRSVQAAHTEAAERKKQHDTAAAAFSGATSALANAQPQLRLARELDVKLAPLAKRLADATRACEAIEAHMKDATAKRDALFTKRDEAEREQGVLAPKRTALSALAPFAPDAAAWLHRLDAAALALQSMEAAKRELAKQTKEEKSKTDAAAVERAKEAGLRKVSDDCTTALTEAEKGARAHDGAKIATARRAADSARSALRELDNHLRDIATLSGQAKDLQTGIAKLKAENKADAEVLAVLRDKQIPAAEQALASARRAFDLAEAAVTDEAVRLREKLAPDQPCPVCGALEHPHSAHPPASEAAALRALRKDRDAKDKECRALREKAVGLEGARKTRLTHEGEKSRALTAVNARLASLRATRHEHPSAANIAALSERERPAALTAQLAAQQQALDALDAADEARLAAEKLCEVRRANRDKAAAELAALEKKLAKLDEELAGLRAARTAAAKTLESDEAALKANLDQLSPLPNARESWNRDPAAFRKTFADGTSAFLALEKRLAELSALMRETDAALVPARETLARAEAEQTAKRADETTARADHETVRTQRAAIFSGRAADAVETEFSESLRRAGEARDLLATQLANANSQRIAAAETLKGAERILVESTSRHTAALAALEAWLAGRDFDRDQLDAILTRDDAWIKAERAALDAMEGAVRAAEGALAVHQKTLTEHSARRPTTEDEAAVAAALIALRAARAEAEQRRDAARAILVADDQRIASSAALSALLRERQAAADPWVKLNDLIGSADGAKFRGIAQRRTLDILLGYANAQLDQLAARYRLERLPESLNLIVIDRDMGDERRSVHSLSGGESFLVSLALALALASLTSNRLRIESLFIDEGFGSLDPETLNTAMNALMHLEAQGRKVGVISHVAEMADAIPVQIRVVKGRSGASRIIVPGAPLESVENTASEADAISNGSATAPASIAERILEILRRDQEAMQARTSVRSLREEIGCSPADLKAARDLLGSQILAEGKSLALAPDP